MSFFYYGTASYYARTSSVAIRYWIATNNKTAMDIKSVLVAAIDRYCNTVRNYKRAIIVQKVTYALLIFITSLFDLHTILPSYFHILIAIILLDFGCFSHTRYCN